MDDADRGLRTFLRVLIGLMVTVSGSVLYAIHGRGWL